MLSNKNILAVILALALITSASVATTSSDVFAKKHHKGTPTPINNPVLNTGLKALCWKGIVSQNHTSTKATICESITIQLLK